MAKLKIRREIVEKARRNAALTDQERQHLAELLGPEGIDQGTISVEVAQLPIALLRALFENRELTPTQRARVAIRLYGMADAGRFDRGEVYRATVASPTEFLAVWGLLGDHSPNCELSLNGRWYPVHFHARIWDAPYADDPIVVLQATLSWCEITIEIEYLITSEVFRSPDDRPLVRPVLDILHDLGLRRLEASPAEFNSRLANAERTGRDHGLLMLVAGPVLAHRRSSWWSRPTSYPLGTPESPRRVVVEPELEAEKTDSQNRYLGRPHVGIVSRLPFVRVFSLDTKDYVYADVDDLAPYEFDEEAIGRLHLPPDMLSVLERVFRTPPEAFFGDLIGGKHGGAIILASGNPGVGKTLTAEVYAEWTRRPLYVLEVGELMTRFDRIEENLRRVFMRVARWDAVLLLDECDIFLTKRSESFGRSALVGIFLRLLDYYRGILFLTTNRVEVLDHAVLSRVMLHLQYPDLDRAARASVWGSMLRTAGLTLVGGDEEQLAEAELNGRQIRNLTRLARILQPDGAITPELVELLRRFSQI